MSPILRSEIINPSVYTGIPQHRFGMPFVRSIQAQNHPVFHLSDLAANLRQQRPVLKADVGPD